MSQFQGGSNNFLDLVRNMSGQEARLFQNSTQIVNTLPQAQRQKGNSLNLMGLRDLLLAKYMGQPGQDSGGFGDFSQFF